MSENIKNPLMKKDRDYAHDIAKGIGILLVMQVHIFDYPKWYLIVIAITEVWLMPFYFTLSGYYYRPGARTPWQSIKRRTLQLVKPYFIYSVAIWVITTAYNLITASMTLKECAEQYLAFLLSSHTTEDVQTMGTVNLFPVIYCKTRPNITRKISIARDQMVDEESLWNLYFHGALRKSIDWAYQNEWRLLLPFDNKDKSFDIKLFPITKVFLGNKMPAEKRKEIISICKNKNTPYIGVKRNPIQFEMQDCEILCENCAKYLNQYV